MQKPEILVTEIIDPAMDAAIRGGLNAFNDAIAGYNDRRRLAVIVQDPDTGKVLGGMIGRSSLGLLTLEMVYLPEALRGSGIGTEILRRFEDEGRRRRCRSAVVYTISFQAPGFYERNGWRRFGEIACEPPGTSRVFLTKEL